MLDLNKLYFSYGGVRALTDISMSFPRGQITCVMGRNGVGKTTLMRNIVGLLRASSGSISLDGREITPLDAYRRVRSGIALVPQGRMIFPKLTVEENLRVGLQAASRSHRGIPGEVYETFPVLKQMAGRRGGDLSGGQQQQLAIARAMVGRPKVILLDEPTEGIQPNIIQQIGHVLQRLASEMGMTVVLVEQYLDFVRAFGHRFYVMNRGRVVAQGPTAELTNAVVDQHLKV